jgi:excisionase family DNA binding protein
MEQEEYLTMSEICQHLKISKETCYRLIYRKGFPFTRINKLYRFKKSEVDKYLKEKGKLWSN